MMPEINKLVLDAILARLTYLEGEVKRLSEANAPVMPDERRARLCALLDMYRTDHASFLHDKLPVERHPLDDYADRITALFAGEETPMLQALLQSSEALVTRFEGELTRTGTQAKVDEEVIEFKQAVGTLINLKRDEELIRKSPILSPHLDAARKEAAQELIDCIVTLGGMASYAGLTWADIESAVKHVIKKNTDKTEATHVWHDETKTVMRRDKLEALK